jgi:hypothetical protein
MSLNSNWQQAISLLSLSLFETRILFINNIQLAFAANDLTIGAAFFDGCSYFHNYFIISGSWL